MNISNSLGWGTVGMWALFASFASPLPSASAQARGAIPPRPGLRLIETGPGQRSWMNEAQIAQLSMKLHSKGHCGGFVDVTRYPVKRPVAYRPMPRFAEAGPAYPNVVNPLIAQLSSDRLFNGIRKLSSFHDRHYKSQNGVEAALWIRDQFLAIAAGRTDITVELVKHSFAQPSVIARIQGRGQHGQERIILGAHEDSINWNAGGSSGAVAPGADDDASGIATLLETFYVLVKSGYQPDRTIEFMAYAAEEAGLLGSQDIAEAYQKKKIPVAGVLQMDMTAYPGARRSMTLIKDHVDRKLTEFTAMLIDTYVKAPWNLSPCNYACSDHASWTQAGYASTFPFESPLGEDNPKIHTPGDITDILDPAYGLQFAKLCVAWAVEMGTMQQPTFRRSW